jgi:hypothetical protein
MTEPIHSVSGDDHTPAQRGGADWNSQLDALVAGMQGPESAAALARGFAASPEQMAAAALAAARRDQGEQQPARTG